MEIVCGQRGIVALTHPGQGAYDLNNAGFKNILLDFSVCISPGELEAYGSFRAKTGRNEAVYAEENSRNVRDKSRKRNFSEYPQELYSHLKPVMDCYEKSDIKVPVARAPFLFRNTRQDNMQELFVQLISECIAVCGRYNCGYIIVQPLSGRGKECWEMNRAYYLRLAGKAAECGVTILIENQCRDINGHLVRGVCADGREAAAWVDALNMEAGEERFGFCMDVGACNLCGQNMYDFVHTLENRIKVVVLRDCDGVRENAMLPFTCVNKGEPQTDWLNLIRGLREVEFDGVLLLDHSSTAACFSPLLRPELLRMSKAIGEYFAWQIGLERLIKKYSSIVLFGAGNMCRNYMMCYGEKYPPLFTCDNNSVLWNTEFCGLMVKAPECLKELPEECAVFICNIFYREIETQLRNMGIRNPIEFFNDEYMPVLPFDDEEYS